MDSLSQLNSKFLNAAQNGDLNLMNELSLEGVDLTDVSDYYASPNIYNSLRSVLISNIDNNKFDVIALLFKHNLQIKSIIHKDSLIHACIQDDPNPFNINIKLNILSLLIDNNISLNGNEKSIILHCITENRCDIIQKIFDQGHNCLSYLERYLSISSSNGKLEPIKLLFKNNYNINPNDKYALNPALFNGHLHILDFFSKNGSTVFQNEDIFLRLVNQGNILVIDHFVDNGFDIYKKNYHLVLIAAENNYLHLVKHLVEKYNLKTDGIIEQTLVENDIKNWIESYHSSKNLKERLENELISNNSTPNKIKV